MAPFQYDAPAPNPYALSIGELLLHRGDIAAHAAETIAAAHARATEQSGAAWAGAASDIGRSVGATLAQMNDPRRKLEAIALEKAQHDQAAQRALEGLMTPKTPNGPQPPGETAVPENPFLKQEGDISVWDVEGLSKALAAQGKGLSTENLDKISNLNKAHREEASARAAFGQAQNNVVAHGAGVALGILREHPDTDPNILINLVASQLSANKTFPPAQIEQVTQQLLSDPSQLAVKLEALSRGGSQAPIKLGDNDKLLNPNDPSGPPLASNVVPKPPTEASLAVDLSSPDPVVRARAEKAMAALKPPKPPASIEEQLLEAISTGNTQKADQIKTTLRTKAEASKDPAQVKLANELAALRADEARTRLDALKKKAEPIDVSPDVQTTRAGRSYVDLSLYTTAERDKAREAANKAGAVVVSKEQANALQEIDNARANQQSIMSQIQDALPGGAVGRLAKAPLTVLQQIFQTDEQKAAFASWRTAAIQTLRATAGSKGLRINQAEIAQAIENDIPRLTDTLATAQQKVQNINTLLENAETSILVRDRHVAPAEITGPAEPASLTPGLQRLRDR